MILRAPPLRQLSSFLEGGNSSPTVSRKLSEPLWHAAGNIKLLVHCVQLHTLLETEIETSEGPDGPSLETICRARPLVRQLVDQLHNDAELFHAGPDPLPLIQQSGLACMCPLVSHFLGDQEQVSVRLYRFRN